LHWFKLFSEFAADPKVQSMPEVMQRRLVMLWCLCCQEDPARLSEDEIALWMRIKRQELDATKVYFVTKGFIESNWSVPHFATRQAPTDPTAAERQRRYRDRNALRERDLTRNGPITSLAPARDPARPGERKVVETKVKEGAPPSPRNVTAEQEPEKYDAEALDVARHAAELGGSPTWAAWALAMVDEGYRPAWIKEAMHRAGSKRRLDMDYAEGILHKYRENGGSDRERRATAQGGAEPPPRPDPEIDVPEIPADAAGAAVKRMYAKAKGRKKEPPR
jgi:hypothetical protein